MATSELSGSPTMIEWISAQNVVLWWLALGSALTFIGTLVLVPILVIRIPEDYFVSRKRSRSGWRSLHPVPGLALLVAKNVCGVLVIVAGVAMLLLPGQGILTIVLGIMLLNFPGKYRLERRVARMRPVARSINWMRARAGHPPLKIGPVRRRQAAVVPVGGKSPNSVS